MSKVKMSEMHKTQIFESLLSDYSKEQVESMLLSASFEPSDSGVLVIYDNKVQDMFYFVNKVLVHESEVPSEMVQSIAIEKQHTYDSNQELIAKQAEQIKLLRETLKDASGYIVCGGTLEDKKMSLAIDGVLAATAKG